MRKNILITGASTGLGEGMARLFAAQGCNLALCARRLPELETLQSELQKQYPNIKVSVKTLDVNDHDRVFSVFREFAAEFGELDRIVVNAGIASSRKVGTGHFAENKQTLETNVVAMLAQCEVAVEIFRKQNKGHLVTMSSIAAARGFGGNFSVYCASKAAVACLTEGIRVDLLGTPIKVTTIYPGYILTDINRDIKKAPFRVDRDTGCKHLVNAINSEVSEAFIPAWPWKALNFMAKQLPVGLLSRFNAS